jgi:hypothetical protein
MKRVIITEKEAERMHAEPEWRDEWDDDDEPPRWFIRLCSGVCIFGLIWSVVLVGAALIYLAAKLARAP